MNIDLWFIKTALLGQHLLPLKKLKQHKKRIFTFQSVSNAKSSLGSLKMFIYGESNPKFQMYNK